MMKKNNPYQSLASLNFMLVSEAFERDGWKMYHQFMVGNRWVKGDDTVTFYYGHYKLNGNPISKEQIYEMLHISLRDLQVCEVIAPHPINSRYGRAFLEGVRWADAHPVNKQSSNDY